MIVLEAPRLGDNSTFSRDPNAYLNIFDTSPTATVEVKFPIASPLRLEAPELVKVVENESP